MKWVSYGPNALLVQFADVLGDETFARGRALAAELERNPPHGLVEYVPAFTTMLLVFDPRILPDPSLDAPRLVEAFERATAVELPPSPLIEIPVTYDGPDLEEVARMHELTVKELCGLHAAPVYKVYMLGFAPGFPYLGDLHPRLHTPRRASPRRRVPTGSIAIGGSHTGIYSVDSPGGWNIIGHTSVVLFDPAKAQSGGQQDRTFLLRPGDRVKFLAGYG